MKLKFRGWRREVYPHNHAVAPLAGNLALKPGSPMKWTGPMLARGKVCGVALTGDFQVDFEFSERELKNWLTAYLEAEPEKALALISSVQLAAVKKLLRHKGGA
jgi:hypothetical protein